jgi:hypothetical protein
VSRHGRDNPAELPLQPAPILVTVPDGGTIATDAEEPPAMSQHTPIQLHDVAAAILAERRAQADRERFLRQASAARPSKIIAFPIRPTLGRLLVFPDRTPPAPEAA